jgi:hypothetical protein
VSAVAREARSKLRRWCPVSLLHQDADDPWCGMYDCREGRTNHRLRLRRMLVCSVCEQGYFKHSEFEAHECWSAY